MTLAESRPARARSPISAGEVHREKRVTTSDGPGIAYEVLGRGDQTIVLANFLEQTARY